jgi:hypothetical protein
MNKLISILTPYGSDNEIESYIDSVMLDIELNKAGETYSKFKKDDYIEDFREYLNNKS